MRSPVMQIFTWAFRFAKQRAWRMHVESYMICMLFGHHRSPGRHSSASAHSSASKSKFVASRLKNDSAFTWRRLCHCLMT